MDEDLLATSTPNLVTDTLKRKAPIRSHFYSNAAPSKVDGNVFRYDFVEQVMVQILYLVFDDNFVYLYRQMPLLLIVV